MSPTGLLVRAARRGLVELGVSGQDAAGLVSQVCARYDQPHRHHHTVDHLDEMQAERIRLAHWSGLTGQRHHSVTLAVLFHDVVYDPSADDNERASAAVANQLLTGLVPPSVVDHVVQLVVFTAGHNTDGADPAEALLHDTDLWVLSAPWGRYQRYRDDVRAEYGHLDDTAWRQGRTSVLRRLRAQLVRTGYLVGPPADTDRRTHMAVDNIDRELRLMAG